VARTITAEGWALRKDFNPLSPIQVMAYLKAQRYRIPTERGTGKATTNDEGLNSLLTHHCPEDPVLPRVLRLRRLRKGLGYLSDKYLGVDQRFHPIYTFLPKTGRLSAKAPNIMNVPKGRGSDIEREIAKAIRECFLPFPGHVLMEIDWRAIEALLVGFFAQDETYMRAAKLDIHSALGAMLVQEEGRLEGAIYDWNWPDQELEEYFAFFKKEYPADRFRAKKKNHAGNYGQGARSLARDLECSFQEAKFLADVCDKTWPKIPEWRHQTRLRAHYEGQLMNPFGYPLSFFEVYKKQQVGNGDERKWRLGKEANECLAFQPQSTGAAMLREALLYLIDNEEKFGYYVLAPIHDSALLSVPADRVAEVAAFAAEFMTRPWEELNHLSVDVEIQIGPHLAAMETYELAA